MLKNEANFIGWRKIFWPVQNFEIKKVLPLALMMFCILFNYTILRDAKDGLIVTAPGSGAETINFLKLYGTLPFAIILMAFYAKISTIFSRPKLFYIMMLIFAIFFFVFGFILFPMKNLLHISPEILASWKVALPRLQWFLPLIANWTYSLFYIFSELWGTIGVSVLFWQLANDITKVSEAKRFYPLFGLIGNVGLLCSGFMLYKITDKYSNLDPVSRWDISLKWIITALLILFLITTIIYNWIRSYVMTDIRLYNPEKINKKKKKKNKNWVFRWHENSFFIILYSLFSNYGGILWSKH